MAPSSAIPFLHVADALSLILLVVALTLLRKAAVEHLRIELARLGDEAVAYWSDTGGPAGHPALRALVELAESAAEVAPRITPARLLFVARAMRRLRARGAAPDPLEDLDLRIAAVEAAGARAQLGRYRLELYLKVGAFHLLGSLSGAFLLTLSLTHMALRVGARPGADRAERFVEFSEKLFASLGRRALRLALAPEAAPIAADLHQQWSRP